MIPARRLRMPWGKTAVASPITHRMKSWLKNSTVPAIFLIALALGTLWICFLLATHRHTGIFKTMAPPGPQHTVTLTWKASTTAGVGYNVYRRDLSGTVKLNPQPLTATTYVDRNVQSGADLPLPG